MLIDIQAPDLSLSSFLEHAQRLAESLSLHVIYSGDGRLTFTQRDGHSTASSGAIVSVPAVAAARGETLQTLKKNQRVAPKGAIVATNGERIAVLAGSRIGWKEIES